MPSTHCVACQDSAIDAATRDPVRSNRAIARQFPISEAAVRRHRTNHLAALSSSGQRSSTAGGRPVGSTKLTDERVQRFLMAVRAGSTFRAAARSVGWSEDSFQRYRAKDAVFAAQVEEADGLAEVHLVAIVRQAAQTNWRAALELLGRRWPESWGRSADAQPALLATPMVVTVEFDRPDRPLMLDAS